MLLININAQIIFFAFQKFIVITIVFHQPYQCAIMSEITWNITLHGSNWSRLLWHFIIWWLLMLLLQFIAWMKIKWFVHCCSLNISNHYGIKCVSNLILQEPCNVMFNVISDIIAHWNDLWNKIVIGIVFCNAKKIICA